VPAKGPSVALTGAVRRPGEYELGGGGSLRALLELVGGVSQASAGSDARLTRVGSSGRKETFAVDLSVALKPPADVPLEPGDALFVPPLSVLQDVVEVRGAFGGTPESSKTTVAGKSTIVQRFELAQGDRVRDLVFRAGGAAAHADLQLALVERGGVAGPRQRQACRVCRSPATRAGRDRDGARGRGEVVAGLPDDHASDRVTGLGGHRALRHLQRAHRQIGHVRSLLGAQRAAVRQHAERE